MCAVLLCVLALYLPTLSFDFLNLDDNVNFAENTYFHPPSKVWLLWGRPFKHLYIPLTYTVWAGVAGLFGLDSGAFHALNVLTFAIAVLLVYGVLHHLVRDTRAALLGTAFFALHPTQVESVAWATSFKGLFGGTLALGALLLYLMGISASPRRARALRRVALFVFALSLLAKSTSLVLPAMMVCWRRFHDRQGWRDLFRELWAWFALAALDALVAAWVYPGWNPMMVPQSPVQRVRISLDALTYYLRNTIYPFVLSVDYGRSAAHVLKTPWTWITAALPIGLGAGIWRRYRRTGEGEWVAGTLAFAIGLLPTLGLKPHDMQVVSTACDRYLFLPLVAAGYLVAVEARRFARHRQTWLVSGAVLGILAGQTAVYVPVWRNNVTFWEYVISVNPSSFLAYNNLGAHFDKSNDLPRATEMLERYAEVLPTPLAFNAVGALYLRGGRARDAVAILAKAIRLFPETDVLWYNFRTAWHALSEEERSVQDDSVKDMAARADRLPASPPPITDKADDS